MGTINIYNIFTNSFIFIFSFSKLFEFDGLLTQNQVSFPGLTAIPIGDSHYTIETWVKSALDNGGIISWGNENLANSYNALRYNGDRLINYWWSNDLYTSPLGMTSSVFYHIVAKYDGTNREIWVNGTMSAQDTPGVHSPNTFSNLLVGVANAGFGEYLNGGIGALKIFNKSLSSTQIINSFNASRERFGYQYGSFVFDSGSNQYLSSSSSDYIIGTGDFTIEAFVKSLTQSGYDGIISLSPQSDQLGPRINAAGGLFEFWTSNSGGPFGYTMSNNIWYHVAMTRNSGTVSCFINGELKNQSFAITRKTLNLYSQDMYQIMEVKMESIVTLLVQLGWLEIGEDEDKFPNVLMAKNMELIRQVFIYMNGERHLPDNKKMRVGEKCEMLIAKMIELEQSLPLIDIPNLRIIDDIPPKFTKYYNIAPIIADFKGRNILLNPDHVDDGKNLGIFGEVVMKDGNVLVEVDFPKLLKLYPIIRFMNAVKRANEEKSQV